jgi:hypothetical protein
VTINRLGSSPIPLPKPSHIAPNPAVSPSRRDGPKPASTPETGRFEGFATSLCKQEVTGSIPVGSMHEVPANRPVRCVESSGDRAICGGDLLVARGWV